jgi:hypothetical protein
VSHETVTKVLDEKGYYVPSTMPAAAINRELDRIDVCRARLNEDLIAAGRGSETYSQTLAKDPAADPDNPDLLTAYFQVLHERRADLMHEVARRAGPGMRRLPRGFGPIKGGALR